MAMNLKEIEKLIKESIPDALVEIQDLAGDGNHYSATISSSVLFMKGTPDAPQCGFSMAISNILKILNIKFKGINVLENEQLRQGIKEFSDWPTIPQLYLQKEFVGGCDIIKEMYENGELIKIFEGKNIAFKK